MTKNIELLIEKYITACLLREKASKNQKAADANKYYNELSGYYKELKESNLLPELRPLLYHKNSSVRLSAAAHLLAVDEIIAKEVITEIMESEKGLIAFTAKMILTEWNKGGMKKF